MQLTEHLAVDSTSFFKVVKQSILDDIENARGKKAKASNVHAGYSYKKYLRGKVDPEHAAQVHITEWDPPHVYSSRITSQAGETTLRYVVEECEDGGIDVTYTEEFEGASASQNAVQKALGAVKQLPAKSKVKRGLHAMESQILADRYVAEAEEEFGDDL